MASNANLSLNSCIEMYLRQLVESPRTQRTYDVGLRTFLLYLTETRSFTKKGFRNKKKSTNAKQESTRAIKLTNRTLVERELPVDVIDTNVLEGFQAWLAQKSYSRFSQRTYLASARAFLNYALGEDWLPESFSLERARAKLRNIKKRGSYPIPRPDPALPRLIAYFDEMPLPEGDNEKTKRARLQILRNRAFVHLLYSSAGRLSEVASLDRKDVADGRRRETIVQGKGDKERFIFITPEARAAISLYIAERRDEYEPLFISHGRNYGARFTKMSLWRVISHAAKKLNMDASPHDFRHFRARQMLEQGAPLEAIQEILGHSDIGTTRRVYAHYSKPSIRTIFERTTLSPHDAARAAEAQENEGDSQSKEAR
ncbi:MAG: tyrosine-type recombinase/integrase [Chloroflexi bacterium]|nr:tyrosine-type recombinase/integrase [Chloroflexota bacterium]